jgi:methylaspartate ammonia-lyase
MDARRKDSLLWGLVGALAFLVLVQGYELVTDQGVALAVKGGVALAVLAATAAAAHTLRPRLAGNERS